MKKFLLAICALAFVASHSRAQQQNTDFQIVSITPDLVTTPEYSISYGPKNKKVAKNKDFVELEVTFDWQPRAKDPQFLDDLTVNYYVLLSNKSKEYPKGTLLTGSVTHTAIPQSKGLNSVMYISPRTLERFFDGKAPTTVSSAIVDVGVTITKQGQFVAEKSWKGKGQWWSSLQQVNGYVLNKNESPFAPLAWDYYEAIKARPAGL
ncbi:MAG: Amuc_1102 family pilus-like protein [Chthoniobacterales bacterium]